MADTHGAGDCVDDRASRSGSGAASGEMTRSAALRSPSGSPKSASGGETHSEPASFGDGVHDEDSAAKERAGKAGQAQHGPGDEKEKEKECDGGTTVPMAKFIAQRTLQEKWREKAAHGAKEQAVMAVTVGQLQKELHEARRRVDSERDTLLVEQVTTLEKQLAQLSREIREQLAADGATSTQLASRLKRAFPQSTARAHGRQSQGLAVAVDHGSKESQNSTPSPTPPITPSNRPSSRHSLATNHGVERERAMEEHQGTPGPPGSTSPRDLLFEPFCLKCFREVNAREKHVPLPARATQKLTSESLLLKLLLLSRKQAEDAEATRLAQKQRIVECDSHIARLHTLILKLQQELKRVASGAAAPSTGVTISDLGDITASLSYMKYSLLGLKGSVSSVQQFITDAVLRADRAVGALGGLNAGYDAVIATLQGVGPKLCAGLTRLHDGHKQKDRLPEAPDVPGVGDLGGWQTSHLRSMQRLAVWVEEYAGVNELIAKEEEAAAKVAAAAAAAASPEGDAETKGSKNVFPRPRKLASQRTASTRQKLATMDAETCVGVEDLGYLPLRTAADMSPTPQALTLSHRSTLLGTPPAFDLIPTPALATHDCGQQFDGIRQVSDSESDEPQSDGSGFAIERPNRRSVGTQCAVLRNDVGTSAEVPMQSVACGGPPAVETATQSDPIRALDQATTTTTSFYLTPSKHSAQAIRGPAHPERTSTQTQKGKRGSSRVDAEGQVQGLREDDDACASKAYTYKYVCEADVDDLSPPQNEDEARERHAHNVATMRYHLQQADEYRERVHASQRMLDVLATRPPSPAYNPPAADCEPPAAFSLFPAFAATRGPRWGAPCDVEDNNMGYRGERATTTPSAFGTTASSVFSARETTPLTTAHVTYGAPASTASQRRGHSVGTDVPSSAFASTHTTRSATREETVRAGEVSVVDVAHLPIFPQQPAIQRQQQARSRGARRPRKQHRHAGRKVPSGLPDVSVLRMTPL